ncbi:hypothetical protein ACFOWE_28760 [Planomonospora corallina]|uniref:DUF1109 domain-containing protein n=1 Tax=Planomonospora corallina TaxID=1806052 RepID=A0ABV8IFN3_9ACTN
MTENAPERPPYREVPTAAGPPGRAPSPEPPLPALTRALTGPPGRWLLPATALAGLLTLYGASAPGGHLLTQAGGALALLALAVVWIPRFTVGLLRADGRPGLRRHWVRWAAAPLMVVAVSGLIALEVPFSARFALSEASLERFAREVSAGSEPGDGGDRRVGLYPIASVDRAGNAVLLEVADTGFLDRHGFAWSPSGAPPEGEGSSYSYVHLHGPWYEWRERW